jgi:hypothetical protein
MGLGRLKHLQPPVPLRRYHWARLGDMMHVVIKHPARFDRVGHRITGDRRLDRSPGAGHEKAHVAIDDATRLAYAEVLPDEKQATTACFLIWAVAWFGRQGIECWRVLSNNGSAYRSQPWQQACEALGLSAKCTRPYTPRTNCKAERFIKTLVHEWAYGLSFQSSEERNRWLGRYLAIYNGRRCYMALAGRTPSQQLGLLRATE